MFDPVDPKQRLPALEEGILKYWQEEDIFKRSVKQRSTGTGDLLDGPMGKTQETYSFYDGPPFATGLPHYGHLLAGTIKDVIPRYQTMRGKYVERRFGWDCHGLPVENIIEQEKGIKSHKEIEEMGVDVFNGLCRTAVQRYTKEWRTVVERMGRWVDMDWDYRTMDPEYMESIWWVFAELCKKELVYEGHKPMHICPRCVTPLSNFEVTQGYKDITDTSVTVKFELLEETKEIKESKEEKEIVLRAPKNKKELEAIHDLRIREIFKPYHPKTEYDRSHPDDKHPDHELLVFVRKEKVIGTVRLDCLDKNRVAFRLVAIDKNQQGKGLGALLLKKAEAIAMQNGRHEIFLNAENSVIPFYEKQGYAITDPWEPEASHGSTPMKKTLQAEGKTFILAWTTTPWTLPGNLLLAVDTKMKYVKLKTETGETVIFAKAVYEKSKDKHAGQEILGELTGKQLIGKRYVPLFPYFAKMKECQNAYRVVGADFVTADEGTGVVHIAPGFGEDDFNLGKKEKLPVLQHVTMEGKFVPEVTDFAGIEVKPIADPGKTDRLVTKWLKEHGKLFAQESYTHSYPHCWRCDSPLLNYATSSWFISVEKIKDDLLAANAETEWVPAHIRDGRFGKWLEGARDWAISRNRYWGTPLPIWRCAETNDLTVIASRDELMAQHKIRFTKITALRHGESEGNLVPIYQGNPPGTDLTDNGRKQATAAAAFLKGQTIDAIYCSPLARTRQTAAIIAKKTGAPVIVDPRLCEVCFGDYEGKTVDFSDLTFIKARRAHKMETGTPESIYHFPGMERWSDVADRIGSFMEEVLPLHRGGHVVLVTHADPIQNLRHFFGGEDPVKLSHQPYPLYATPYTFFWDHETQSQLDLHKHVVDEIAWAGSTSKTDVALTLVRHGQVDLNKEDKVNGGNIDSVLNETGRAQVQALARKLKKRKFDVIVSSDLKRAMESAEILSKELKVPHVAKWKELRERDTGEWTGKPVKDFVTVLPDGTTASPALFPGTPPKGESLHTFLQRLTTALAKIRNEFAGKSVLVVCHSGPVRGMQALVENLSYAEAAAIDPGNADATDIRLTAPLKRIPEVLDCWFESGSMPYAQSHFPFDFAHALKTQNSPFDFAQGRQLKTPLGFPADFIAEGIDQTRGWFYTLMILSTALFKKPAFRNCIVNGIVLAEDGKKMSKRLKNYPEPTEVVHRHGADAVRFTLMTSPAVRGEDLKFSEKLVEETVRAVLLPLWNVYSFFVTYANAAKFEPTGSRGHSGHPLDRYVRAEVQDLVNRMTHELDAYDLSAACSEIHDTIDALTNWYVRLSRRRFAGKGAVDEEDTSPAAALSGHDEEQLAAVGTLYDVLLTLCQTLAPFCPFLTEAIYLNLVPEDHTSIHLSDWPEPRELTDEERALMERNRLMRHIVSLGHAIRSGKKIKVRQPLARAMVALPPALVSLKLTEEDRDLLKNELNVKDLEFTDDPGKLACRIAQVDARKVGPRLGARVQEIIRAGKSGEFTVKEDGSVLILDEVLAPDEVAIVYRGMEGQDAAVDGGIVVCMETAVTADLKREGQARDLIRAVQKLRKEAGLHFTDRITLSVEGLADVVQEHGEAIAQEVNAHFEANEGTAQIVEVDGVKVTIRLTKK